MRVWLLILLFPTLGFSQPDSVTVAVKDVVNTAETILDQRDTIVHLNAVNEELTTQINLKDVIITHKDTEISLLTSSVDIGNSIVEDYKRHLRRSNRWNNSKVFYFVLGLGTAYVSSLIINNN